MNYLKKKNQNIYFILMMHHGYGNLDKANCYEKKY